MRKNLRISENYCIFASEKGTNNKLKPQDPEGHRDYEALCIQEQQRKRLRVSIQHQHEAG